MGWTFRFLEQLEDDLRDAAARERVKQEGRRTSRRSSSGGAGSRWPRLVAASVAVLVVAGAIGGFAEHNSSPRSTAGRALSYPGIRTAIGGAGNSGSQAFDRQANLSSEGSVNAPDMAPSALPGSAPAPQKDALGATHTSAGYTWSTSQGAALAATTSTAPTQRDLSKIVRKGTISVEVPDGKFPSSQTLVTQYVKAAGGYILSSSAHGNASGTFVLRIPAKQLDSVMNQIGSLPGGKVLSENRTSQDVTAQFVDSGAQLQILRAEKAATLRYLKNAGSLSQAIQFRNQAFNIQGEIDKLQGTLNYLSNQVALATVTVNIREQNAPVSSNPVEKPSLVRAWDRAVSGFLGVLSAVIVGLGFLIPVGILAAIIFAGLTLVRRRRRATNSAP